MKFSNTITKSIALLSVSSMLLTAVPTTAMAQSREEKRREQKKEEWKKIGIGSGLLGLVGLVTKNGTLTFLGAGGALYSAYRYEEDRKSKNRAAQARYKAYNRSTVWHNGKKYVRKTTWKNGKKYYYFARA
ncbi:MAG: hypothetical protein JNJ45_00555 [Chthonomonas sp.]|nr:hypothetical protein [Chthonomonas sp.]